MRLPVNKIICHDSAKLLNKLPCSSIDLVITSPPYGNLREYSGLTTCIESMIDGIERVLKTGGVVIWVVGPEVVKGSESLDPFNQVRYFVEEQDFRLHDTMIFEKNTSSFPARKNSNRYSQIFEYMFVFSKGKPKTVNLICDKTNKWAGFTNWGTQTKRNRDGTLKKVKDINPVPSHSPRNNIWKYTVSYGMSHENKIANKHPATFPLQLAVDHILSWSDKGDVVLDPMCGSGTVCVAAKQTGRKYIGIDIHKPYCDIAKERLQAISDCL